MAGYPEHIIEEVRDRAEIVEVIGEVVPLKKRGKNWVGLCPFHTEKTPSFNVTPEKQMYYCFGCQAGGNVFTFIMEYEKLEFPDALRALAERTGVELPEPERRGEPDPNEPLFFANRLAAEFYHRRLRESDDAAPARQYLEKRGIKTAEWEAFLLGWAPDSWEALLQETARHDMAAETLVRAGLAGRSEKTGGHFDQFRGRLCFPIRSLGGKVVALSGRRLDDEEPKYLNSPDTPIFNKGRMLFNLDQARSPIRRIGAVVLVEGNFDVVALHQAGFQNVVAPLGTAFTPEQARTLRRYTGTVYIANDGDPAGERSAFRTSDVLLSAGFAVRIVQLPEGQDPDSLVRKGGPEAFEERLKSSEDVINSMLRVIQERVDLDDIPRKRRAIKRLMQSVARIPDPVTQSLYADKISAELHVPKETLALPSPGPAARPSEVSAAPRPVSPRTGRFADPGVRLPESKDERYIILHAVSDVRWLKEITDQCRPEFFTIEPYGAFFRRLLQLENKEGEDVLEALRRSEDPEVQRVLARVEVMREREAQGEVELSDRVLQESIRRLQEKAVERGVMIGEAESTGDPLKDALRRRELKRSLTRGRLDAGYARSEQKEPTAAEDEPPRGEESEEG